MTIQKNDFIELEFTGYSNGEIFDTTKKQEAEQLGLNTEVKPLIVSVGNEMLLKGFDEALEGKEINKEYKIDLTPENAFGKRNKDLIKIIPKRIFIEKNLNPVPGLTVQLDNNIAKILSVSGGRITVDFNNPLAGKDISYKFKILKKIENLSDKINALQDFFFKQRFEFEINQKNKKIIFKEQKIKILLELMNERFASAIGYKFDIKETKENSNTKKQQ